jgi:NAD(P)-dependent dehydrogenase (short-subunit alcohol dehydrogenase family)
LVAFAVERLGRLDAVVSNAGIMVRKPVTELAIDEWRRVIDTNLTGTFLLAKHAAPHLRAARGSIVTIASTRALMSEPDTEAYAASKGGLVALTHALAVSLGPEVRANCVSPGWIDTKGETLRPWTTPSTRPGGSGRRRTWRSWSLISSASAPASSPAPTSWSTAG